MSNVLKEVLQICHSYSPPFDDCARQYAALFNNTQYRITTVFLTGVSNDQIKEKVASDEVIFLEYDSKDLRGLKLNILSKIREICKNHNFEVCIAHRTKPTYVALLATNIPVLSIHHAMGDFDRWGRKIFTHFFKKRLTLVGVSNAVRENIRLALGNWPDDKLITVYNRIDLSEVEKKLLSKKVAREKLNIPEDVRVIANVGRLHPDKDQATLIKAFAKILPHLKQKTILMIIGSGKLEKSLKQLSNELNLTNKVVFTGSIKSAYQYFPAFDLFVLSSDHEPFGMVLLEAMAAEVPILCSNCGGGAEVASKAGKLFDFGNIDELAKLIAEAEDCPAINTNAIPAVEKYFSDEAVKRNFFDQITWLSRELIK